MMHFDSRVYRLPTATTVRVLLGYLDRRVSLAALHITLLHEWEGWLLRVRSRHPLPQAVLRDSEALLMEYGEVAEVSARLSVTLLQLDRGLDPLTVMQRYQVPVISYGEVSLEDLESFCEALTQGLGSPQASLK